MAIDKNDFFNYINTYNDHEIFYKKLFEEEMYNTNSFNNYLKSLDLDFLKDNRLYVPQIHKEWISYLEEGDFFISSNIEVFKHNRYSPEFIHEHEFYEIIYVYKGQCKNTINRVDDTIHREGDVCIIPPKTKHSIGVFDDSIIINIAIKSSTFHSTFFDLFTGKNQLSEFFSHILYSKTENNYLTFKTNSNPSIRSIVEDIFIEFNNKGQYYNKILNSYIIIFWSMLLRYHESNIHSVLNTNTNQSIILQILNYLHDNFKDVTLSSVASNFGYSVPHLSKILKDSTGKNFTTIIKDIKLEKACKLLKETSLSISTICELIGYSNPEHFSRLFKNEFNISPGKYRSNNI